MTAPELKPCPFCGSDELSHGWSSPGYDGSMHSGNVECHSCGALIIAGTEAEAIAAWNTRHREAAEAASKAREAALVEAFQKVADHLREEADKDKYGTNWRPLYYSAEQIERAILTKEPDA